jgi:hypothetical protein
MAKLLNIGEISFVLYLYGVFHENMKGLTSLNVLSFFLFRRGDFRPKLRQSIIDHYLPYNGVNKNEKNT